MRLILLKMVAVGMDRLVPDQQVALAAAVAAAAVAQKAEEDQAI